MTGWSTQMDTQRRPAREFLAKPRALNGKTNSIVSKSRLGVRAGLEMAPNVRMREPVLTKRSHFLGLSFVELTSGIAGPKISGPAT